MNRNYIFGVFWSGKLRPRGYSYIWIDICLIASNSFFFKLLFPLLHLPLGTLSQCSTMKKKTLMNLRCLKITNKRTSQHFCQTLGEMLCNSFVSMNS